MKAIEACARRMVKILFPNNLVEEPEFYKCYVNPQ